MTISIASQIADLLNRSNNLVVKYNSRQILNSKEDYIFNLVDDEVIACAKCKKVQWYQWEISHVSVKESELKKGYGKNIIRECELRAVRGSAKIIQCTIRNDNFASIQLFKSMGYEQVNIFFYEKSGNYVYVYQKCVSKGQINRT
ncbi:MAG: GNAT family N-acetyltransferase [Ignavibacteriae bacterium]|nr:GNAT family N-acetyltransferase [Ignavibacteriota bacterium]